MIQISEVLNLIFDSIGLVIIIILYRYRVVPRYLYIFIGFACVWAGNVCTVAEGFMWYDVFNLMEHLFYVLSGFFFLLGFLTYFIKGRADLP